jgi:DNA-binding transcriptional ArsR family regulator
MSSALTTARDLKSHFVGLANPTRLAIVSLLAERDMAGSELARKLKLSQPLLSWHLRVMRRGGLIATRRVGREVLCSLDRAGIRAYQERFNQLIDQDGVAARAADEPASQPQVKETANAI